MEPHMHHLRQSSALHSQFAATKKVMEEEETDTEEEEEEEEEGSGVSGGEVEEEPEFKKKRMNFVEGSGKRGSRTTAGGGGGGGEAVTVAVAPPPPSCRAEKCNVDLTDSKTYHKRHKVCEYHAKAEVAMVEGLKQRFCQQCSRFHELSEFDGAKRSCRRRLAGHNERRRKHFSDSRGEGSRRESNPGAKKDQCRQVDERGRTPIALSENHQNLHIH